MHWLSKHNSETSFEYKWLPPPTEYVNLFYNSRRIESIIAHHNIGPPTWGMDHEFVMFIFCATLHASQKFGKILQHNFKITMFSWQRNDHRWKRSPTLSMRDKKYIDCQNVGLLVWRQVSVQDMKSAYMRQDSLSMDVLHKHIYYV